MVHKVDLKTIINLQNKSFRMIPIFEFLLHKTPFLRLSHNIIVKLPDYEQTWGLSLCPL